MTSLLVHISRTLGFAVITRRPMCASDEATDQFRNKWAWYALVFGFSKNVPHPYFVAVLNEISGIHF